MDLVLFVKLITWQWLCDKHTRNCENKMELETELRWRCNVEQELL